MFQILFPSRCCCVALEFNKTVSTAMLHLTVLFVILFKISFGFRLLFGLDQVFHGLNGRNTPFFYLEKSREPHPINLDKTLQHETASKSSVVEYLLKTSTKKPREILHDSVSKDKLENAPKKENEVLHNCTCSHSSVSDAEVDGKNFTISVTKDSSKTFDGNTSKVMLDISLETAAGKKVKPTPGTILEEKPSETFVKNLTGTVLEGTVKNVAQKASSLLTDASLENITENTGKQMQTSISEGILKSVDGKTGKIEIFNNSVKDKTQNLGLHTNSSITVNSLGIVITELSNRDRCVFMSAAKSFPQVPEVALFVNTFLNAVHSSDLVTITFNITEAKPREYSQFKYRFIFEVFRKRFDEASEIAAAAVQPITKYFDVLTPQVMMRIYSNFLTDFLFAQEILTTHNAKALALKYFKAMEEGAKLNEVNYDCHYNQKFQAIADGTADFFFSLIEPSLTETWQLGLYYAHEWLLAAMDYGALTVKK